MSFSELIIAFIHVNNNVKYNAILVGGTWYFTVTTENVALVLFSSTADAKTKWGGPVVAFFYGT